MKNCSPSLVDVVLTNKSQFCFNPINFGCGISDWHNMIGVLVKGAAPKVEKQKIKYRSYKNFDEKCFNDDINQVPFHVAHVFEDVDDIYWAHEWLLNDVINQHAPIKERISKPKKPAFINGDLRRAVFKKKMLFNKYKKCPSGLNWDNYRKQRNAVTKLKKQSMRHYFFERCSGGPKSKDFWPTIKPFLSKKGSGGGSEIILSENDKIISDQKEVCNVFNSYFVNVAKDIGKDCTQYDRDFSTHPSIQNILKNGHFSDKKFSFRPISENETRKIFSKLNVKKSTGVDNISAKLLKACAPSLSHAVSSLINLSFAKGIFPSRLKNAQVIPLYKKKDSLNKENYRPVSILPTTSKIFERVIHEQLSEYLDDMFNPFLAAFRKGYGCQTTLLRLLEDWRSALDKHEYVAAILMDLSKAFDCLPHNLLLAKLQAYGVSQDAVKLIESYLSDRSQQIRMGSNTSDWENLTKGVPQGSILGPLLFNVFINDIFYIVEKCSLYNYADDNTLAYIHKKIGILHQVLVKESLSLIQWFENNLMKANPDKFQAICVGKRTFDAITSFQLGNTKITCEDKVSLLGVTLDVQLNFKDHISQICTKASQQLAVLKRIGKFLTKQGKLMIYKSFIMSNFNHCPIVWHFCNQSSANKMEKIQERALRFICDDFESPLPDLLQQNGVLPLHISRMKLMAGEVFKIVNNIAPSYLHDLISLKSSPYDFRSEKQAQIPRVNSTRYGLRSFRYEAARIWNSLPNELRLAESYPQFRRLLRAWDGLNCKCPSCSA